MALPYVFANVTQLNTPELDADFNALGALAIIPCTATGTNTIALTPAANTPTIAAYSNLTPVFAFLAVASNSGATTINVNGLGAKPLYKNNGATAAGSGDIVLNGLYLISYNSTLNGAGGGFVLDNPSASAFANTTTTRLLSGTAQTYTPPAGAVRFRVRMSGPGGGGGAVATNPGVAGSASTTFQVNGTGTAWGAVAGSGGAAAAGAGGAGGSGGSDGTTGNLVVRIIGGRGQDGMGSAVAAANGIGGQGGSNPFGGAGAGRNSAAGTAAAANTGGGGGGAGGGSAQNGGSGGGAGEYVEFWVTNLTNAIYTIGAGGAGGAAGTNAGGAGAAGIIVVEEFYF